MNRRVHLISGAIPLVKHSSVEVDDFIVEPVVRATLDELCTFLQLQAAKEIPCNVDAELCDENFGAPPSFYDVHGSLHL